MNKEKDNRLLVKLLALGYFANFSFGLIASFFPPESFWQMTSWQIGDSMAIMASVLASRQVGARGQNLSAAGFTMLAIAYGVSFASSSIDAVNEEKIATVLLHLVPAIFLINFCRIFPSWLRYTSLLICIPFFFMYWNVIMETYHNDNLSNVLAYTGIQLLGVFWAIVIWKDFNKQLAEQ